MNYSYQVQQINTVTHILNTVFKQSWSSMRYNHCLSANSNINHMDRQVQLQTYEMTTLCPSLVRHICINIIEYVFSGGYCIMCSGNDHFVKFIFTKFHTYQCYQMQSAIHPLSTKQSVVISLVHNCTSEPENVNYFNLVNDVFLTRKRDKFWIMSVPYVYLWLFLAHRQYDTWINFFIRYFSASKAVQFGIH